MKSGSKRSRFTDIKNRWLEAKRGKKDANLSSKCAKTTAKQSGKHATISLGVQRGDFTEVEQSPNSETF